MKTKRKLITRLVVMVSSIPLFVPMFMSSHAFADFSYDSGSGTLSSPYIITTCDELQSINDYVNNTGGAAGTYFQLGGNIDCIGFSFMPIGNDSTPFQGNLNGAGYSIENLTIAEAADNNIGLFGETLSATISDIALTNVNIAGAEYVGGFAGQALGTTIDNVYVTGLVVGLSNYVGGIAGFNSAIIENSYSAAAIEGNDDVGELVGEDIFGITTNSFGTGNMATDGNAGFIGAAFSSTLNNDYTISLLIGLNVGAHVNGGGDIVDPSVFYDTSPLYGVYTGTPAWDFTNIWKFNDNTSFPLLRTASATPPLTSGPVNNASSPSVTAPDTGYGQSQSNILLDYGTVTSIIATITGFLVYRRTKKHTSSN